MFKMKPAKGNHVVTKKVLDLEFCFYKDDELVTEGNADELCDLVEKSNPMVIKNMADVLGAGGGSPLWVVFAGKFGGAAIAYHDFIDRAKRRVGDDFYILPSSIYELLIVSADGFSEEEMSEMVRSVNSAQVAEEERLANHAYHYHDGRIEII